MRFTQKFLWVILLLPLFTAQQRNCICGSDDTSDSNGAGGANQYFARRGAN